VIGRWGETGSGDDAAEIAAGPITVRVGGALDRTGAAALLLVARFLGSQAGAEEYGVDESEAALIGGSEPLAELRRQIDRWGRLPVKVLVLGEPGTGKELVASELHRVSARRGRFVVVNCAGLPRRCSRSELFGVVRVHTPVPTATAPAWSKKRRAARCSSTRSANCRSSCRRSYCGCFRLAR
jgi:hypothetical protein